MARQNLNRGTIANDGTGDTLRTAAQKINENFTELYTALGGDSAQTSVTLTEAGVVFEGQSEDNAETTLCVIEPTADNIVYIPNTSGTLLLDSASQTLSNKTILSPALTTPSIKDADLSHSYNVVVSNLSANRNVTLPLLTTNDTFVFADATQTLNNKTINGLSVMNPTFGGVDGGSFVFDSAGDEYYQLKNVSSAVNYFTFTNAATGDGPTIDVDGDDANISLRLGAKGTGAVEVLNKMVLEKGTDVATSVAVDLTEPLTVFNAGSLISPTIGDGTIQGEIKTFMNIGAGQARLTPAGGSSNIFNVDSSNGFLAFDEGDGCQLVWNTTKSKWFLVSNNGTTTG